MDHHRDDERQNDLRRNKNDAIEHGVPGRKPEIGIGKYAFIIVEPNEADIG